MENGKWKVPSSAIISLLIIAIIDHLFYATKQFMPIQSTCYLPTCTIIGHFYVHRGGVSTEMSYLSLMFLLPTSAIGYNFVCKLLWPIIYVFSNAIFEIICFNPQPYYGYLLIAIIGHRDVIFKCHHPLPLSYSSF